MTAAFPCPAFSSMLPLVDACVYTAAGPACLPTRLPAALPLSPAHNTAASRVCDLTGKRANNGYVVTFSHKRNKKLQQANLQYKKVYWPEGQR